ncbi:MAG TPA: glycosyltransferase [Anaerolineae bacterium]|nr:glycosyltransferase [Anaerolineae bacterium]
MNETSHRFLSGIEFHLLSHSHVFHQTDPRTVLGPGKGSYCLASCPLLFGLRNRFWTSTLSSPLNTNYVSLCLSFIQRSWGQKENIVELDGSKSDPVPTVTVVVPMRNEEGYIAKCLGSIVEQDYPKDSLEVLVVDGLSDDRSREIVKEFRREHPFIRLLDNPGRIVPTAMNIGIKEAEGEVIIRVDGHCRLAPDYISQCVRYLKETGAACVGGTIENIGQTPMARAISLAMSSPFRVGDAHFRYSHQERYVDTLAFGAYRREVFDKIGLFDEKLVRNQDYDLNYRLRKAGGKILLTPAIKSHYYTRSSLRKLCSQYFQYGFWKVRMLRKYPRSVRVRQLVPPLFVLILLLSGVLSAISSLVVWVFALVVASYLGLALAFSFSIAARKGWRYLPILPVIFACLHLSWGLGFLYSLTRLTFQRLVRR